MYYIGISAYYHESSVFLTDNKGTNCFLKEESFSRIKGDKNFPQRCLKFLIKKLYGMLHLFQMVHLGMAMTFYSNKLAPAPFRRLGILKSRPLSLILRFGFQQGVPRLELKK